MVKIQLPLQLASQGFWWVLRSNERFELVRRDLVRGLTDILRLKEVVGVRRVNIVEHSMPSCLLVRHRGDSQQDSEHGYPKRHALAEPLGLLMLRRRCVCDSVVLTGRRYDVGRFVGLKRGATQDWAPPAVQPNWSPT